MEMYWCLNDDHSVRPCERDEALKIYDQRERKIVARDETDEYLVSTVFLAMNHAFDDGPPMIFETMIFGGPHDESTWRYSTWDEAVAGHERAVRVAKGEIDNDGMDGS